MSHHTKLAGLAAVAVLVSSSGASALTAAKPKMNVLLSSCKQSHVNDTTDTFDVIFGVTGKKLHKKKKHKKKRPSHAANVKLSGVSITATLDGPYVTDGTATGKTDGKGLASLTLVFGGPGDYTLSWTAKKPGYKTNTGQVTLTVSGPTNAPCQMGAVL